MVVASSCLAFRALITQAQFEKVFEFKTRRLEALGEFSTVMQTRDEPLSCLYQAMQTRKTFSIA